MVLRSREDCEDVRWRFGREECRKQLSAKAGIWFQGCEQPIRTMLLFIRPCAEKWTILSFCRGSFDVNEIAAVRLNAAMRRVAEEWLLRNPVHVGGPGLMVEVDEILFPRRKYNRGRVLYNDRGLINVKRNQKVGRTRTNRSSLLNHHLMISSRRQYGQDEPLRRKRFSLHTGGALGGT
uniref:ISXO2-like transposase domain-containing protein n=1 Tax=Trichuris muris TaxID=70415 RepID=A0A5S6R3Y9_TRIMR